MADLRIVDAPEIPTENITGEEKLPTGGNGNYSISLDSLADYTKTKKDLVDTTTVDGKVNGVRQELDDHIEDLLNPHQVTKGQIGLGNVDNTADLDKPVSNSTQAAIISAVYPKADKSYVDNQLALKANKADVYTKSETYTKQESSDLVSSSISTALTPVNSSLDLAKRGIANRYDSSLTYNSGERVILANGDIVKSTVDGNTNNPNVDMTGWKLDTHIYAYSIAQLKSLKAPIGSIVTLAAGGRSGSFVIKSASEQVALDVIRPADTTVTLADAALSDTFSGIYIQTQNGVAVRELESRVNAGWFGVSYDWDNTTQSGTDDSLNFEAAMHFALSQQLIFTTESGAVRIAKLLTSQKDSYWKRARWHANNTRIIVDHAGSGIRLTGGASVFSQTGTLTIEKSNQYKTNGGNTFPPTTTLNNFLATKNAGLIFDGNKHEIESIECRGFNVGALFSATGNMNYSKHNISVVGNDVGVLIFGTGNDLSVIRSEIFAYRNFQEAIYVKDGVNFREWVSRFRAEDNLLDRANDPSVAGRYAVYIGHHTGCEFWCYVEQYPSTTPGTHELYISDTGSSEVYSARRNNDYVRGNNQGRSGNTLYQHFWINPPAIRQAVPLKLQGRGVRFAAVGDYVDLPVLSDNTEYGGLRGEAGRIKLRSTTAAQEISLSDSDAWVGKRFNTVVVDAATLTTAAPTTSKTIKTLWVSGEGAMGTLHVVGGAFRSSHGYAPYVLKVDFYINNGTIVLNEAGKFYNNPSEGNSSAVLRLAGNTLYLDLSYSSSWWGADYKFKYKVEILTGMV